jgi:hypothetical protein
VSNKKQNQEICAGLSGFSADSIPEHKSLGFGGETLNPFSPAEWLPGRNSMSSCHKWVTNLEKSNKEKKSFASSDVGAL